MRRESSIRTRLPLACAGGRRWRRASRTSRSTIVPLQLCVSSSSRAAHARASRHSRSRGSAWGSRSHASSRECKRRRGEPACQTRPMSWVLTILGICALVVLHELGHFTVAKAVGMRVERFSLFFPPTIFKVRRGETEYAIGALPLGGYVKISGMNPEEINDLRSRGGAPRLLRPGAVEADRGDPRGPGGEHPDRVPAVLGDPLQRQPRRRDLAGQPRPVRSHTISAEHLVLQASSTAEPADGVLRVGDRIVAVDGSAGHGRIGASGDRRSSLRRQVDRRLPREPHPCGSP